MRGRLIVLEGPDGAGTTTQCRLLAERLRKDGIDVLETAEPTDGPVGRWIREILKGRERLTPLAIQVLFSADRAWHAEAVIEPALHAGTTVICDRYWHSTLVYAEAQDVDAGPLRRLNEAFPAPDLVIFTLPPVAVSLERMERRSDKEFFEREEMQRRIHECYAAMAASDPSIVVVDTSKTKEESADEVYRSARERF